MTPFGTSRTRKSKICFSAIRNDNWTHKCSAFISSRHSPYIFESAFTLSTSRTRKSKICFVTGVARYEESHTLVFMQALANCMTFFIPGLCLAWRWRDSNSWPPACKAGALPTELRPRLQNLIWIFKIIWQPPTLPYRLQHSTIGRLSLNHRVRDENGCFP